MSISDKECETVPGKEITTRYSMQRNIWRLTTCSKKPLWRGKKKKVLGFCVRDHLQDVFGQSICWIEILTSLSNGILIHLSCYCIHWEEPYTYWFPSLPLCSHSMRGKKSRSISIFEFHSQKLNVCVYFSISEGALKLQTN